MRVHELDEKYGVSKDEVKAALKLAGLKTHHMADLDEEELVQFEAALELSQDDAEAEEEAHAELLPVILGEEDEEPVPEFSSELREHPGTGEESEPVDISEDLAYFDAALAGEEVAPVSDVFRLVDDAGRFKEEFSLPPDLAEKVREILGDDSVNSYVLDLDRREFRFVIWERAQKFRVQLDV